VKVVVVLGELAEGGGAALLAGAQARTRGLTAGYGESNVRYSTAIGEEELCVRVINITYLNNAHTVTLTGLTGDVDLFTYSDAFVTAEDSSQNAGLVDEVATGTTTARCRRAPSGSRSTQERDQSMS
jgi:hypothetical protein